MDGKHKLFTQFKIISPPRKGFSRLCADGGITKFSSPANLQVSRHRSIVMILVQEFNRLDTPASRDRTQPVKSRRQRRQEERESVASKERSADRIRSAKVHQKSA